MPPKSDPHVDGDGDAAVPTPTSKEKATVANNGPRHRRLLSRREQYKAGIFTNERGNLRFVAVTVRHPCKIFVLIWIVTLLLVMGLFQSFIPSGDEEDDESNGGNPFSDPGSQYNTNDVRSLAYDSLRLAVKEVADIRDTNKAHKARRRFLSSHTKEEENVMKHHPTTTLRDVLASTGLFPMEILLAKKQSGTMTTTLSTSTTSSSRRRLERNHRRRNNRKLQGGPPPQGANNNGTAVVVRRTQEQLLDITYWVYEADVDNDGGVFGSAASIAAMRESHDLFLQHVNFEKFCWKEYYVDQEDTTIMINGTNSTTTTPTLSSRCRPPTSALNVYYPKSYDPDIAASIIEQLSNPSNVETYNAVSLCLEFDMLCDYIPPQYNTTEIFTWATALHENITILADAWDGSGELVEEPYIEQVTTLIAHLLQLRTKRGYVDFGLDQNFALNNTISQYSRAIFVWGGPLPHTASAANDALSDEDREEEDEEALKEYFVEHFLDDMNEIASPGHNDKVNTYYFMIVLILEVLLDIVIRDALMAIASFVFVFLYLRLTVGSWFLAIIGMAEIILSVPVSWFLYKTVLRIEYFAFLNVLTLYIVAAIGADDIFIFMDAYKQSAHSDDPEVLEDLESRMSWVYRRTGSAMFITSATTCAAFLCTLITPLVDIRSFGIFAAIVIFMDYVLVMTLFCTAVVIYHNKFERPGCCSSCTSGCRTADPSSTTTARANIGNHDEEQMDRVSRFFRNTVAPFVGAPWSRIVMAILFVAWIAVASFYAIQLEPTKEAEQFLRSDHPLQRSLTIINSAFLTTEDDIGLEVYFAWGLGEVDRDGVNQLTKPEFLGEPKFVDTFQFTEQCQTELMSSCATLRSNAAYQPHIKQENGLGAVSCFVEEFAAFSVLGSLTDCVSVITGTWRSESNGSTWQVPIADVPAKMESFVRERSCYSDEGLSVLNHYSDEIGWDGTRLRFVALKLENSVVDPFSTLPEDTVRKEYEAMLGIAKDLDQTVGAACNVGTGTVIMTDLDLKFIFMNNQGIYRSSALQSALLGVGLAFAVLLVSTRTFHIAFFATITITCVLISVTGTMVLIGWTLGSIESVLISIVAGFAVDYVVHLAHSYTHAYGNSGARLKTAFSEMGISVLHGMITSVGASVPLFLCQLTFFRKFGTFMFLTISFSWVFANFIFMSALAQFRLRVTKHDNDDDEPQQQQQAVETNKPSAGAPAAVTTAAAVAGKSSSSSTVSPPPRQNWTTLDDEVCA